MAQRTATKSYGRRKQGLFSRNAANMPLRVREDCPIWERASQIYALLILALFPLLLGPQSYYNITITKFILFSVLTGAYTLACVVIGFVYFPGRRRGRFLREKTWEKPSIPQILLFAYLLWALLSAALSPYEGLLIGQSRYEGVLSLILYCLAFLLLSFWGEYTDSYVWGLGGMSILLGFIALVQSFGSKLLYPGEYYYWNLGFLTTIGNADCVAGVVSILVPALLCAYVLMEGKQRWLCLPGLFFLPYIAIFTDVDTAKIGLLVAVLMFPWLFETRERLQRLLIGLSPVMAGFALGFSYRGGAFTPGVPALVFLLLAVALAVGGRMMGRHKRSWSVRPAAVRRAAYVAMLLVIVLALVLVFNYSGGNRLLQEASELLHGRLPDEVGTFRGYIWKCTWELIKEQPIFGGGPGSFPARFNPYNPGYMALVQDAIAVDFPHNDFLAVASNTGLVGLALYLAFLLTLAVRCFRRAERCPVLLIFLAGMMGYLVYAFFVFSIAIVSPLFWAMAGVADHLVKQVKPAVQEEAAES